MKLLLCAVVLCAAAGAARADGYVIYLHGRSMSTWPSAAELAPPGGWWNVPMNYDGSASLGDGGIQGAINDTLAGYCSGGNLCIVVCYSAGCARMLLAYQQLQDQGRYPDGILWSEAAGSAAGGSELAVQSTKWWVKLLAKIFKADAAAPIDYDIQPNQMRYGAYATIQNAAVAPIYHLAGSANICQSFSILGLFKVKLCGNQYFPGSYGDGAVPVHSSGGYADTGAHASTNDGSAKYVFRAYEQTPLYPVDHAGILGPLVNVGSLRLGVAMTVDCPGTPPIDDSIPDASIVYDDADGAVTTESSPLNLLVVCGQDNTSAATPLYASCLSASGCCTAFSTGDAGGCVCGETVCRQPQIARASYYTGTDCTGTEYAEAVSPSDYVSFDGLGMDGETTTAVTVQSTRQWPEGVCQALVSMRCMGDISCCDTRPGHKRIAAARQIYRPAGGPPPPDGTGPDYVFQTTVLPGKLCNL